MALTLLIGAASAQEITLTPAQLANPIVPFGAGTVDSFTPDEFGVLIDGDLGDKDDFSRIVISWDFFGAPIDASGADVFTLTIDPIEVNTPFLNAVMFIQTADGMGGFTFIEGSVSAEWTLLEPVELTVPLTGIVGADQVARVGFQAFGPGALFPSETPIVFRVEPSTPPPCNAADVAEPFGVLDAADTMAALAESTMPCEPANVIGMNPLTFFQDALLGFSEITGDFNGVAASGNGVVVDAELLDNDGFSENTFGFLTTNPVVDASANDTIELEVQLLSGEASQARLVVKEGPTFFFVAGDSVDLTSGEPMTIFLDTSVLATPEDIREIDIQVFGPDGSELSSTNFELRVRPVGEGLPCGPTDLVEPIGVYDAFDILEHVRAFNAGCP
ncbi:MAG: hypothetical protein CMJ31_08275 [Phycisphaerae bacterium]|nr:hypothetical protein [Phycisphaerae bacterium]